MTRTTEIVANIALKTMLNDIIKSNPNATITDKKMRAKLRATPSMREIHEHNASWIFTQSQYDVARAMFDPAYATLVASRAKRNAKSNDAPRVSRKRVVQSNVIADVIANAE